MDKKQIVETVESYLAPILEEFKFTLIDVEYVKEGPNYYLRVYIDKEGGIPYDGFRLFMGWNID